MAFITNPQKARAHSSLYIHNQDKRIRWLCLFERIFQMRGYSFASFIRMNLENGFKLRNCIIGLSTVTDLFVYNLNMFLSVFISLSWSSSSSSRFRSVHQGLWWLIKGFFIESISPYVDRGSFIWTRDLFVSHFFCTFVCLCLFFVIQWVRFRNRNWNIANFFKSFSSTLSTNIKKTSTQIYFVNCKWFKRVRVTPDTLSHLSTGSNGSNVKCLIIRITFRCRTSNPFYRIKLQMRSNQFQNQESIAYNN